MFNLQSIDPFLGFLALITFGLAYLFVMTEEMTLLRKSKPVLFAGSFIWFLAAMAAKKQGVNLITPAKQNILEYAELFLFLLVSMTYINAIESRQVFEVLKGWLIKKQLSYRLLFWITGLLAFVISPIADNMTTALIMCAIVLAVGIDEPRFVSIACINIVVAANAGGAFCPFGDITTLMVWQKGALAFNDFFNLFLPCAVNFVLPAFIMQWAIPDKKPPTLTQNAVILPGGLLIAFLFLVTLAITVSFHHFLSLPPAIGMTMGFAGLHFASYYLKQNYKNTPFDVFDEIRRVEWDTLFFFYGVILCIGGLAVFGYLHIASQALYEQWGTQWGPSYQQTPANIVIGILSAIIDNIPLMFAVLTMDPIMSQGQWLLITLTAGVGGSLLSIGSAAGVALMGQSKGQYTFFSHLKWTWAIALGYFASIGVHCWINRSLFSIMPAHV